MFRLSLIAPIFAVLLGALPAASHEFWIEAQEYQVPGGGEVRADLRNGEIFKGAALSYNPMRFTRFEAVTGGVAAPLEGRIGDIPAVQMTPPDGLLVLAHETTLSRLTYKEWEKFAAFAEHKDFPGIEARHAARDLPREGFREGYTRHVKALVAVGDGAGSDRALGLETEFVALANPYADEIADGLPVRLLYQGAPRADAQIEVFERAPDGAVTVSLLRSDDAGEAVIPVQPGHTYLLDAVVLREPVPALAAEKDIVWETLWAGLSFAVPQ